MSEQRPHQTATIDPRTLITGFESGEEITDGVPVEQPQFIDPRAFFENLRHRHGEKARAEYLAFREGEVILREGDDVRKLLLMRCGEVALLTGGKLVSTYVADRQARNGASAIISAADYCYSTPSSYMAVAQTHVEILAIDTRVLRDMGLQDTILLLCRNMLLFSDMAVAMRAKIEEEFERTGLPCFSPDLPEDQILRMEPASFEEYYRDFAARAMADLMAGRIYRAREEHRSTAIVALPRQAYPITAFKSF